MEVAAGSPRVIRLAMYCFRVLFNMERLSSLAHSKLGTCVVRKQKSADALLADVKKEMAQPREAESVKTKERSVATAKKRGVKHPSQA
jgi:hypothetical protein